MAAASSTGLDGIVKQVVGQPLQVAVTHEGILSQMTERGEGEGGGGGGFGFVMEIRKDKSCRGFPERLSQVSCFKKHVSFRLSLDKINLKCTILSFSTCICVLLTCVLTES